MADQYLANLSTTWNSAGSTLTGIKYNITDTASASDSALINLLIGGTSMFRVQKDGEISTQHYYSARQSWAQGTDLDDTDVNGSNILTLGTDGNYFQASGTQQIDGIASISGMGPVLLVFSSARTLTHNGTSFILPGAANITTAAGDSAIFVHEGSGNWRCVMYTVSAAAYLSSLVEDTTPQLGGDLDLNGNGITFPGATVTDVTGADTLAVSGTAGTNGNLAAWNADGDLVDAGAALSAYVPVSAFTTDGGILVATGAGTYQEETGATLRTSIGALASTDTITDALSGFIEVPTDQDYRLVVKAPFDGTITETVTRSASGTATATFKINTTALGGTANSVSSTENAQAHSTSNTFSAGDDIVLTISSNSSCVDMSFTIKFTRALS